MTNGHSAYSTRCATGSIKRRRYDMSEDENENTKHKPKLKVRKITETFEDSDSEHSDTSLESQKPKVKARRKAKPVEPEQDSASATSESNSESESSESDSGTSDSKSESHSDQNSTSSDNSGNSNCRTNLYSKKNAPRTTRKSSRQPKPKQETNFIQYSKGGGSFANGNSRTRKRNTRQTRNQGRRTVRYEEDSDNAGSDNNDDTPPLSVTSSGRVVRPTARVRNTLDWD